MSETKQMNEVKANAKGATAEQVRALFQGQGVTVEDGATYGKKGSLIIHLQDTDVQVKFITPNNKAGYRYATVEVEE